MGNSRLTGHENKIGMVIPIERRVWCALSSPERYEVINCVGGAAKCGEKLGEAINKYIKDNISNYFSLVWPKAFKEFMCDTFKMELLEKIVTEGIHTGFPYFTTFEETEELYGVYHEEIEEIIKKDAIFLGVDIDVIIVQYNGGNAVVDARAFKHLKVLYVAEHIVRNLR